MSALQRLLSALLPERWARAMESESRAWLVRCACGCARSVWELGGIRVKASGRKRRYLACPQCGRRSWHTLSRDPQPAPRG
ncbi:MAG TPA: hypothetical protein VFD43_10430 [Planctomycetota bacterium]|nr:hypothetical protein [Planctomycetota bacterium]